MNFRAYESCFAQVIDHLPRRLIRTFLVLVSSVTAYSQVPVPHTTVFRPPPAYVAVTSGPAYSGGPPWATMINETGLDIIGAQPLLTINPLGFTLDETGSYGESIQSGSSLNYFPVGPALATAGTVSANTLPATSCTSSIFAPTNQLYALDYRDNTINIGYPNGTSGDFGISLGDAVGETPITMTGNTSQGRSIVVSQNIPYGVACNNIPHLVTVNGTAAIFDAPTVSIQSGTTLQLGKCPVYAITSPDGRRSFVVNRGDDSVTVINMDQAAVDQTIQLPSGSGPVYAEYVARSSKLLIANYENDTVSIINVQLDENTVDGPAFGQIIANVDLWNGNSHKHGKHPASIAALPDGTRAYVADQEDGTISVLDLKFNEAILSSPTVPGLTLPSGSSPRSIAVVANASTNSLLTKLFVTVPGGESVPYVWALDNQIVNPTCPNGGGCTYAGNVIDVHVSTQNTSTSTNTAISTRLPGAGQPCGTANFSPANMAACLTY